MAEWHLGQTSVKYETGGRGAGTISSGKGDHGGVSYGSYQLSSSLGRVQEFIAHSEYKDDFAGLQVNSEAFKDKWRDLAAHDPKFGEAQHAFIQRTHFEPQMKYLKDHGIDLAGKGPAVQDMIWSTSVQFGPGSGLITQALTQKFGKNCDESQLTDKQIVEAVQDYKIAHNEQLFSKSSEKVRASTLDRAHEEKADLVKLAEQNISVDQSQTTTTPTQTPDRQSDSVPNPNVKHGDWHTTSARKDTQHNGVFDRNDHGEDVKQVQTMLVSLGANIAVDGVYGPDTERAVKGYQMMNGLTVDGIVGPNTMAALREDAQRVQGQAPVQAQSEQPHQGSPDKNVPPQAPLTTDLINQTPAPVQYAQAPEASEPVQKTEPAPQERSAIANTLEQQAEAKVREFCEKINQPWNQGMDNTVAAIAATARENNLTAIEQLNVKDGIIHFAQKDASGFGYQTAQVVAKEAANTPIEQSQQRLAAADQPVQQPNVPAQVQAQSGPKMG